MICRTVSSAALSRSIGRQGRDFWSLRTNKALIVELKSVSQVLAIHEAQLMTSLKLSGVRVGLLINFNVELLKDGIKRFVL